MPAADPYVLYEVAVSGLHLTVGPGLRLDVSDVLGSGRSNYALFQHLAARLSGLAPHSEGGAADLIAPCGDRVEVKAYHDHEAYAGLSATTRNIHTAASSTFGPNNHGPAVKALLAGGDWAGALELCRVTGYDKSELFLYTNTRGFRPGTPFRYLLVPRAQVLASLCRDDPRVIHRDTLLGMVTRTERIELSSAGPAGPAGSARPAGGGKVMTAPGASNGVWLVEGRRRAS